MNRDTWLGALAVVTLSVITGCASMAAGQGDSGGDDPSSISGEWLLVSAVDAEGRLDLGTIHMTLTLEPGSANGTAACNTFSAETSGSDGALLFGPIGQTKIGCDSAYLELERRYLTALSAVDSARAADDMLVLSSSEVELRFELLQDWID